MMSSKLLAGNRDEAEWERFVSGMQKLDAISSFAADKATGKRFDARSLSVGVRYQQAA